MMPLRYYRGWNNLTLKNYIDSLDLYFVQEHWLLHTDFLCVGVSGLSSDLLLRSHPYGGCAILYCKPL